VCRTRKAETAALKTRKTSILQPSSIEDVQPPTTKSGI
jgi:hypothetical protein